LGAADHVLDARRAGAHAEPGFESCAAWSFPSRRAEAVPVLPAALAGLLSSGRSCGRRYDGTCSRSSRGGAPGARLLKAPESSIRWSRKSRCGVATVAQGEPIDVALQRRTTPCPHTAQADLLEG